MKQEIAAEHPEKQVKLEYMLVDLSSFQSVKDFTVAFRERSIPLHVLINNAATVSLSRGVYIYFITEICTWHMHAYNTYTVIVIRKQFK